MTVTILNNNIIWGNFGEVLVKIPWLVEISSTPTESHFAKFNARSLGFPPQLYF